MTTLVWRRLPAEPVRLAMCEWFRRHGIDPKFVAVPGHVTRHLLPALPGVSYESYVPDGSGSIEWDRRTESPVRVTYWLPFEADPLPYPSTAAAELQTIGEP